MMTTIKNASVKTTLLQRGKKASLQLLMACGFIMGAGMMQSCDSDDLLEGQPEWLGNSIFERLEEGIELKDGTKKTFNYTVQLIKDLDAETAGKEGAYNYVNTLSKTGSKTLFAAPDDVYEEYFRQKGITYADLTTAQKKELFNGTMLDNAYILELLSNTAGDPPVPGTALRHLTSSTIYDNIPTMRPDSFPSNPYLPNDYVNLAWKELYDAGKPISIFKDDNDAPMVHFLPHYMQKNNITDEDLEIISNHNSHSIQDSWINGHKVISKEQTCKNGYVYVVDGVTGENKNMAEIIHSTPDLSIWSSMLKRWAVPEEASRSKQDMFHRLMQTSDNAYVLRYLNSSSNHGYDYIAKGDKQQSEDGEEINTNITASSSEILKFDPGWNMYAAAGTYGETDAGAMFVPDDSTLTAYFATGGEGYALIENFGSKEKIPLTTLAPLFNVNMLDAFSSSVPSKFATSVLDEVGRPLGITKDNVKRCYVGCNGVVYVVNKVFTPAKYASVIYPVMLQGDTKTEGAGTAFNTIYHAIVADYDQRFNSGSSEQQKLNYDFQPYLNSMDSRFSLIVPYNNIPTMRDKYKNLVFRMIDPCTYGLPVQKLLEFYFDQNTIGGYYYDCQVVDGKINEASVKYKGAIGFQTDITKNVVVNRLYDYLDNSIIVEDIDGSKEFYKTKAGSVIRAWNEGSNQCFQGGLQLQSGEKITVAQKDIYHQGNGTTYGVSKNENETTTLYVDVPMTSSQSVYQLLKKEKDAARDSIFWKLIYEDPSATEKNYASGTLPKTLTGTLFSPTLKGTKYDCLAKAQGNLNISVFDNYNYTVFVPSDKVMRILTGYDATPADEADPRYKSLPTWDDFNNASTDEQKVFIANRIHEFVRYHIQDNAIYINSGNINGAYETAMLNKVNKRFFTLQIKSDANNLTVTDVLGNTQSVRPDFNNKPVRESWISGNPGTYTAGSPSLIMASSNAVVHMIDDALYFDANQKKSWKTAWNEISK